MDNACFREYPDSGEVYYGGGLKFSPGDRRTMVR